ncbi:penicillin-binding transpeptidase domain-containing protein [Exiguobacterium alkaliphilum]|uniref:Penicillin-binding transpeptidase domain-containing protein n=1 Tax=Exiguobacterium alkaliphilum TaxID=1428684 RepID=A0ABT2KU74_9BACL|nr:penicillin-binding transpeptidase domain-containing protein [Exiguobacterium alkaliphilum]MCT4794512.1 penicillin-binding transpeptidase domain-containing protein [Exiguobacterium alkaliphilum]
MNSLQQSKKRVAWVAIVCFTPLFLFFVGWFFYLSVFQTYKGENMLAFAEEERWKAVSTLKAERGEIFDRFGQPIAINIPSYRVVAVLKLGGERVEGKTLMPEEFPEAARELASVIPMTEADILKRLEQNVDRGQIEFGVPGRDLTVEQKEELEAFEIPGITFVEEPKRYYPNKVFASSVIGYAQKIDQNGRIELVGELGIEKSLNDILSESYGLTRFEKDLAGRPLIASDEQLRIEPEDGADVQLTIDHRIQQLLDTKMDELYKEYAPKNATAIIMDPKTGEIVALSDRPSFDPNTREITSYSNFSVSSRFEPGSTMKIFTLAAAINEGVFDPNELYKSGSYTYGRTTFNDYNITGWGTIPMVEGVWHSSNVAFSIMANERLGLGRYEDYFNAFKFDQRTGVDLPGEVNSQYDFDSPLNVLITAWGQSTAVTPMQILQATSAIATDGTMKQPHVIKKVVNRETGETIRTTNPKVVGQPITAEAAQKTREALDGVVNSDLGTGQLYALENYRVIGKTGTAQIAENGKYLSGQYIHSFVGMAPEEDPELVMYIAVDRPNSDSSTTGPRIMAPLFKDVMDVALRYRSVEPEKQEKAVEASAKTTASYIDLSRKEAVDTSREAAFAPVLLGSGGSVTAQSPVEGQSYVTGERLLLKTDDTFAMPNLSGWSLRDVKRLATLYQLNLEIDGTGFVTSQSIGKDKPVKTGATLKVKLQSPSN